MIQLRDYQQECISIIESKPPGSYLIQMATGMGKTKTFTHIPRHGRVLILSHREELVRQPLKEYDCKTGVEMAGEYAPDDAEVVSASVMSMVKRLDRYAKQIPIEVIKYGNPDNDTELGDLKGHNQIYLRGELFLGWGILDAAAFALIKEE